jgi:hypothetical protein
MWITRFWPALLVFGLAAPSLRAADRIDDPPLSATDRGFWSFRKPTRPPLPQVTNTSWIRTPIDAFILARLDKVGLRPAEAADKTSLLRRVTFDLIGLPPTPTEIDAFLADTSPQAYERVVERLLASPHHGERWGQHWLDVVRYAESNGYEGDLERPHAWRYRDYVVRAFNDDKPYDRFIMEQLAGDILARGVDPRQAADLLIATGFNRCGPVHVISGNTDPEVHRLEVLTEMTTTVGAAFLVLTVNCARCHDHKFDPLSQGDYYRLQAFFAATQPRDSDIASAEEKASHTQRTADLKARMAPLQAQVAAIDTPHRTKFTDRKKAALEPKYRDALAIDAKKRTPQQAELAKHAEILIKVNWDEIVGDLTPVERGKRTALRAQIHDLETQLPRPPAQAWGIADTDSVPPTHVLKRGDPKKKLREVPSAYPRVLVEHVALTGSTSQPVPPRLDRKALATWLTQPDHPLTARVFVNRLWQHHFGRGLVPTPNDFGIKGTLPSHPELLDWLATEFVRGGWSIKHLHRLMVLSATYRQSSSHRPAAAGSRPADQIDPDNLLLSRMNRRRLEAETMRDAALAAAGRLNPRIGGPMVRVPLEPEVYELIFTEGEPDGLWHTTPDVDEHGRRSLYLFAKRNVRLPLLEAFDLPDTLTSCPVRPISTFAPQALIMMNGPFMQEQSLALARRLIAECGASAEQRIERAYRLTLGRRPRPEELRQAHDFLSSQSHLASGPPAAQQLAALADFCLALLNRNEFVYVP